MSTGTPVRCFRTELLTSPSSPHGGGWDHAKGLLVRVAKDAKIGRGELIGLRRGDFPTLTKGYYICDLLGQTVLDENDVAVAVVSGFHIKEILIRLVHVRDV